MAENDIGIKQLPDGTFEITAHDGGPGITVDPTGFGVGGVAKGGGSLVGKGGQYLYKAGNKFVRYITGKPIKAFIRVETHELPGYRNYGEIKHINIGSKHIHKYNWYNPWKW